MQLWNFSKCRDMAVKAECGESAEFVRVSRTRGLLIGLTIVMAILLAALVALIVLHSEEREWPEVVTHEVSEKLLTIEDCTEYRLDMTDGDFVRASLVMPYKSFVLETGDDGAKSQDTYYVFLDSEGDEGIFHYPDGLSEPVQAWLDGWESIEDAIPEPVEIFGLRGELSIGADGELADYDGKSYIEAGEHLLEVSIPIEGAEEEKARIEADRKSFEARRQNLLYGIYGALAAFAAALAAVLAVNHLYNRARRALMADIESRQ